MVKKFTYTIIALEILLAAGLNSIYFVLLSDDREQARL